MYSSMIFLFCPAVVLFTLNQYVSAMKNDHLAHDHCSQNIIFQEAKLPHLHLSKL
uniref:Uncharacterized protein n=1 Tax=Anguilla anguilla TaxID=7936 RepID=A0A0E9TI15_ANGAN